LTPELRRWLRAEIDRRARKRVTEQRQEDRRLFVDEERRRAA